MLKNAEPQAPAAQAPQPQRHLGPTGAPAYLRGHSQGTHLPVQYMCQGGAGFLVPDHCLHSFPSPAHILLARVSV